MRLVPILLALVVASGLSAEGPPIPRHAPEFVLSMPDGTTKLLSSYRGKVVMVEFLYTTCPHCQHSSQVFSKLNTEFGDKGFQPIGVAWDEMAKMKVPDFVKSFGVNFPVAFSDRDKVLDFLAFSPMMRTVVPQIVWIDRKGNIRSQTAASEGDEKLRTEPYWREMLQSLLAEPATGGTSGKKVGSSRKPTLVTRVQ